MNNKQINKQSSKQQTFRVANNPAYKKQQSELQEQERRINRQKMFASVQKMKYLYNNKFNGKTSLSKFDVETISLYLQNPVANEKKIRDLSSYLYNVNSQYKLIINYLALMPMYAYKLTPTGNPFDKKDKIKKRDHFIKMLQYIEKLNLRHEMITVMRVAFREDTFYGYEHESKDSFFIQKMDADYCRISSKEDGAFNFAFNFSFFDGRKDLLPLYAQEFGEKYQQYQATKEPWIELDSDKTIVIKVNEDIQDFALPPLNGMFEAIFDYDEYKKINKAKSKLDVFMALIQKIPLDEKNPEMNKFLIDLDLAASFHQQAEGGLPEGVTLITSPMSMEAVKMEKGRSDQDVVAQALRAVYDAGGVSQFIHNSDKNTGVGLDKSILTDEELVMAVLRQIERWVNRKIKKMSGNFKYKFEFLDMTIFNKETFYEKYLKAAQFGVPVKLEIGASLGLSPLDVINKAILENDILGLSDMFIPLTSAHTQSLDDGGRPKKSEDDISASTEVNRNNE